MSFLPKGIIKFILAIAAILIFKSLIYEPFIIPSGSMKDTLLIGDYIIVSKYSYGYSKFSFPFAPAFIKSKPRIFYQKPERGDVIVFRGPKNTDTNYIKRVIGLPEDTVKIKSGIIYVNEKPIFQDPLL